MDLSTNTKLSALSDYFDEIARQVNNLKNGSGVSAELLSAKDSAQRVSAGIMQEVKSLITPVLAPERGDANKPISNANILQAERFLKLRMALKNNGMIDPNR